LLIRVCPVPLAENGINSVVYHVPFYRHPFLSVMPNPALTLFAAL
jgi:hypothetical protein